MGNGDSDVAEDRQIVASNQLARLSELVGQADGGDQRALGLVRKIFDQVPAMWDLYGDLAAAAEDALANVFAGKSQMTREGLRKRLAAMKGELAGPNPSPLERLAVDRVVACWLHSYHADFAYARSIQLASPTESEHYQRRQDRAALQYLKALKSLAVIRRLLIPQIQVNVGERQVNIAGQQVAFGTQPLGRAPRRGKRRAPPEVG